MREKLNLLKGILKTRLITSSISNPHGGECIMLWMLWSCFSLAGSGAEVEIKEIMDLLYFGAKRSSLTFFGLSQLSETCGETSVESCAQDPLTIV